MGMVMLITNIYADGEGASDDDSNVVEVGGDDGGHNDGDGDDDNIDEGGDGVINKGKCALVQRNLKTHRLGAHIVLSTLALKIFKVIRSE
ncbi:hypothetical protein ElyMa_006303500 [Elysia marginata]|uniref:Uncharacterized protein n=1 Tax=Elysia marginata TaxID=1093978 RepID=A0AAV4HGX1_9GAST|nr:hypothetical protein ElyMa_006303500 [Elysia marginata]